MKALKKSTDSKRDAFIDKVMDVCGKLIYSPDSKIFTKFENLCRMFFQTMSLCHSLGRSEVVTMTTTRYSQLELKLELKLELEMKMKMKMKMKMEPEQSLRRRKKNLVLLLLYSTKLGEVDKTPSRTDTKCCAMDLTLGNVGARLSSSIF